MGTPLFAVGSLNALIEAGVNIVGVITSVDKPAGRGKKLRKSDVKKYALKKGLKILQPKNLKSEDFLKELKELEADLFVVVAFRMLPEVVWQMPSLGTINLHASLLPKYRGAAPINWAIINGERETGVTSFFIEKQIDTGKIILQDRVRILPDMTAGKLHDLLSDVGGKVLCKTVKLIEENNINPVAQDTYSEATPKAPKLFKEDGQVDWTKYYRDVYNFIRGLSPYPTAWTTLSSDVNLKIKIIEAEIEKDHHKKKPGTIATDNKRYLKVAAKDGWIILRKIVPEGRSAMDVRSFLNGAEIDQNAYFA